MDPQLFGAQPPKARIHENPHVIKAILSTNLSNGSATIGPSTISDAGSGLFAVKDIKFGQELFRSNPIVNARSTGLTCEYCFTTAIGQVGPDARFRDSDEPTQKFLACSGCGEVRYCSAKCQKKAWKAWHKHECKILKDMPGISSARLTLLRLLVLDTAGVLPTGTIDLLLELESNFKLHDESVNDEDIMNTAMNIGARVPGLRHDLSKVWPLYCVVCGRARPITLGVTTDIDFKKILTNSMNIRPAEKDLSLGTSLDLTVSMMNHNCDANAFVFSEGSQIRVRALRTIHAGEEIFVSYVDSRMDVFRRRQELFKTFFIKCNCKKCKVQMVQRLGEFNSDEGQAIALVRTQVELEDLTRNALQGFPSLTQAQILVFLPQFVEQIQTLLKRPYQINQGHWPDDMEPLVWVRNTLAGFNLAIDNVAGAMRYALRALLLSGRRRGPSWVSDLHDFCNVILCASKAPADNPIHDGQLFPSLEQTRVLTSGYMQEACHAASATFGDDVKYTRALKAWSAAPHEVPGQPPAGSAAFAERFLEAQKKLLQWAGIPAEKGIQLTVGDKAEELSAELRKFDPFLTQVW